MMDEKQLLEIFSKISKTENENLKYSEDDMIKAAHALNMCMVSISQIIDYDDLNILEQEYEGILNNLNLEMMPKDEALLEIIKQILDTIIFFRIEEGDKEFIDREYQQKMKNAIWNAVPNLGLLVAGGNPVTMAVSLASQVGIGYMNYRRSKSENQLEYDKQRWQLQRSAMEQFNCLRRELFDTAWRLADTYKFPDQYRLTESQIKQYDEILMDNDEIRKYERLTTIKDKFIAYPPFWYYYGSTANHISRNPELPLSDESRNQYRIEAVNHFELYWKSNKNPLLREDQIAASCALEYIDLLDVNKDKTKILGLIEKAVSFAGNTKDVLQLCGIAYLRVGDNEKATNILRILVNEEYNTIVNAQILSGLYVNKVLECNDKVARKEYETLVTRVNPKYLINLPTSESAEDKNVLISDFSERQKVLLQTKFNAVIQYYIGEFSIRLGKLLPTLKPSEKCLDEYFSEIGAKQRLESIQELFSKFYPQKKRNEYLERLSQCNFVNAYFDELNKFFNVISELSCIRDRQKLQELIQNKIVELAPQINQLAKKIEDRTINAEDLCQLLALTSINLYDDFIKELKQQITYTIFNMNDMGIYATTDTALHMFCEENEIPNPDKLIEGECHVDSEENISTTYFSLELLGKDGIKYKEERERYLEIEKVIKKYSDDMNSISEKAAVYFHDSTEFNSFFERSNLRDRKDILKKTIAVYDDKTIHNVDVLFTTDGVVPIVRNKIKTVIPYINLASEDIQKKTIAIIDNMAKKGKNIAVIAALVPGVASLAMGVMIIDSKSIINITKALQDMIDEVSLILIADIE